MKQFLLILLLIFATPLMAIETAMVVVDQAVIYSDIDLTIPIGYAKKGKKIKIGKVARKRGEVLTTVASGRVVYVRSTDVRTLESLADDNGTYIAPKVTDHEVLLEKTKFEDDFSENNHLILQTGTMQAGDKWKSLTQSEEDTTINHVGISIEHRPELRNHSWAVGLNYLTAEQDEFTFKTLMLEIRAQYSIVRFDWLAIDLTGGINGSGDVRIQNSSNGQEESGNMYGYSVGAQAKLFPFSKFGVIGAMEMRRYNVANLGEMNLDDGSKFSFKGFNGTKMWIGLTYKL